MSDFKLVIVTTPDEEEGKRIAKKLIEKELAACVNLLPKVTSIYRWHDEVIEDKEVLLVIKTHKKLLSKIERRIEKMHSYEIPEFLVVDIESGSKEYMRWLLSSLK